MKTRPLNIAVSGLNATDNPGPGVPVIRSIRESGQFSGTITGLSYDPMDPGIYMDGTCEDVYLMAYPSQGAGRLLERIREINEKKAIDVIIPTLDAELSAYLKIRGELEAMGIHTFLPDAAALGMTSKANLAKLSGMGIDVPGGKELYDPGALWQAGETFRFPLVVKGRFYEAHVAYSAAEAEFYFHKISARWGLPVIVQEFVRGEEYDTVALGDGEGGLIGAVPMKKMQLTDKGKAWGGITIEDTRMNRFVRDVIWKLKWRGPCELEMIKEKKTGRFYMIELNPRFPAWCYLSVGAGQNLPWATVKLALSVPVKPFDAYSVGTMFLRNSVDHIYPLPDCREVQQLKVHKDFAVRFDGNTYTSPPWTIGKKLALKADAHNLTLYHNEKKVAAHRRCWQRHCRIETAAHREQVKKLKKRLWRDRQIAAFASLGTEARTYLQGLLEANVPIKKNVTRMLAFKNEYGPLAIITAIQKALGFNAYGADYIENILYQEMMPQKHHPPVKLKNDDLNRIVLTEPSLAEYDAHVLKRKGKKDD